MANFKLLKSGLRFGKNHLSVILTGTGIALDVCAAIATGDAFVKANRVIEAKTVEYDRRLTNKEKTELTWRFFILPAGLAAGGAACHIGSNVASYKKQVALISVATASETAYSTLKDQLPDIVGKKKAQQVEEKTVQTVAQNNLDGAVIEHGAERHPKCGPKNVLMQEAICGRMFYSNTEELVHIQNLLNQMRGEGTTELPYNEFYYEEGLDESHAGDILVWPKIEPGGDVIEISWYGGLAPFKHPDGTEEPYLVVDFNIRPTVIYED